MASDNTYPISGRLNNVPVVQPQRESAGLSSCKKHRSSRRLREVIRHGDSPEACA